MFPMRKGNVVDALFLESQSKHRDTLLITLSTVLVVNLFIYFLVACIRFLLCHN